MRPSTLCALALLAGPVYGYTPSGLLEIHHVNVQQGTCTLVIGPDGTRVLLDTGRSGKGAAITGYLGSIGLVPSDGFDYTIAGHMDSDHIGAFDEVLAAGYDVRVRNLYNGSNKTGTYIDDYRTAATGTTAGAPVPAVLGEVIALGGGATLTVVAVGGSVIGSGPVAGATDENDLSVTLLIEYGDFDYVWGSDLGGGDDDNACTGRVTAQANVETPVAVALTPGGSWPVLSAAGVDVWHVNHHGSESSTNSDVMNVLRPEVAIISVGAGQSSTWYHPRKDVVENVLMGGASCIATPPALVLQTEEGSPTGSTTSFAGHCVGDIVITTDGVSSYRVAATGRVSQGPDERAAASLPQDRPLDEQPGNIAPSASFTWSCVGLDCSFTDTSTDPDGSIVSWSWSFGDGSASTLQHPTHTFAAGGTYAVTLTVTDNASGSASRTNGVAVTGPFTLSAVGYKQKGVAKADLTWNGATSANVDIFRQAVKVSTTANDGFHTDSIGKKTGTFTYKVCEAGTSNCSNTATVVIN